MVFDARFIPKFNHTTAMIEHKNLFVMLMFSTPETISNNNNKINDYVSKIQRSIEAGNEEKNLETT